MARHSRSPFSLWSLLALAALLLAERRLDRAAPTGRGARRPGWWLISRELLLRRFGFYGPTGIAVRLVAAIVRRFTGRGGFGGGFATP